MISKFTTENNFKPNSSHDGAQLQRHNKFDLESKVYLRTSIQISCFKLCAVNKQQQILYIVWPLHKTAIFNFSRIYENASEYGTTSRWSCFCFIFHLCNFMSSI